LLPASPSSPVPGQSQTRGTYDDKTLKLLGLVFDETWETIAGSYGSPSDIEAARTRLAYVLLRLVTTDGALDAERLKYGALVAMCHKERPADSLQQARTDVARETRFDALRRLGD
jgi:hypothetical protein